MRPGRSGMARTADQDARGERRAVHRVVPDREGLPRSAEQDLLVGDQAASPDGVHVDAVDVGAAGAVEAGRRGVGHRPEPGLAPGGRDELRRTPRRAAGRVGLVGVVQLDDLDRLVERAPRPRRSASSAPRRSRSWARPARRPRARRRAAGVASSSRRVVEAGRADDAVQAVPDAPPQVVHHHVGVGEVDDDLRDGQRVQVVAGVDRRHELEVVRAASTARHTSDPTRPRAPSTPTLIAHGRTT